MTMPSLELTGISKRFGSVQALRGADFVLAPGEVHALLGENGAGKSTLMLVAFGLVHADAGDTRVFGRRVAIRSPRDARALGIGMVHQHFTSIEALTVEENIRLGQGGKGARTQGRKGAKAQGTTWGERLWTGLDPGARVETLSVALRQRLEIAKALATGARILLLDEPTALLAPSEVTELIELIGAFAAEGGSVALITHKLPEAFSAADRVTVLRKGAVTYSGPLVGQTERSLAEAMIGEPMRGGSALAEAATGAAAAAKATASRAERPIAVRLGTGQITIHAGELVGIAAVEGNGQRELLRAVAGLPSPMQGQVDAASPAAFVPEDRTTEGLIPQMSVTENLVLGLPDDPRWARRRMLDWEAARARTAEVLRQFRIDATGPDAPARTLSGGNQQKVVLARALERAPRVLVAENPTRGLDLRATAQVHDRIRAAAREGTAVLLYSTDLDEVLALAERVLVVHRGEVREAPPGAGRAAVGEMMLGLGRRE